MTGDLASKDCKGKMSEEKKTRDNFEIFRITLIQITIISFCYVLLSIFSQFTMATVALQNRFPDNFVELTEEQKSEIQNNTVKEFEVLMKNNPQKINDEYIEAVTKTSPSLLFVQNLLWLICFVIPVYFILKKLVRVEINSLNDELGFIQINRGLVAGCLVFLILLAVSMVFSLVNFKPKINEFQAKLFVNLKGNYYLLAWAIYTVGLITGILEEFLFRGMFLAHFVSKGLAREGLFITSFLFGMMHFSFDASPVVPAILTLVGVLFGLIYLQSKNIWVAVGAHATYNSLGLIAAYFLGDKLL
ncbi:MAG: CPBP family intramembrane metalloprotease [Leptospiraceae bacterium]|nr:CPBP family intramembrane metalloprotease [Leptospiraceae bacterium]